MKLNETLAGALVIAAGIVWHSHALQYEPIVTSPSSFDKREGALSAHKVYAFNKSTGVIESACSIETGVCDKWLQLSPKEYLDKSIKDFQPSKNKLDIER